MAISGVDVVDADVCRDVTSRRRASLANIRGRGSWIHCGHTASAVLCSLLGKHCPRPRRVDGAFEYRASNDRSPRKSGLAFVSYWFERDSRLAAPLLQELSLVRSAGISVYLATNQEHLRAAYLMEKLGLADHVDGILYSAHREQRSLTWSSSPVQAAVGLRDQEILLIDDSRENIEAALKAGWQALHWTKHSSPNIMRTLRTWSASQAL